MFEANDRFSGSRLEGTVARNSRLVLGDRERLVVQSTRDSGMRDWASNSSFTCGP